MKKFINSRINSIQSLEDRKIFRDLVSQVFVDLVDYQDKQIENIRQGFFDEMTLDHTRPSIYGTVIRRYEYEQTDDFMFPMSEGDTKFEFPLVEDIKNTLHEGKSFMLGKTFLKCDFRVLNKLLDSGRKFNGILYTNSGEINIKIRLKRYDSYKDIVTHLYSVFVKNGLEWTTPCLPYINKFVAFMIDELNDIPDETCIERIEVQLEEFEQYRMDDVIPVWNLEYTKVQSINFPIPAFDNVLNEHRFDVYDLPSYCYIPDFSYECDGYVKRQKEKVSVIIPESEISEWPMYKLHPLDRDRRYAYENELISNSPKDNFHNGYLNIRQKCIRTKGEIMRLLSSFKVSDMFKINGCKIVDDIRDYEINTYPINAGICDEIRTSKDIEKNLVIFFDNKFENDYMTADIMSFLVSEIQQYFPDLHCVGVLGKGVD